MDKGSKAFLNKPATSMSPKHKKMKIFATNFIAIFLLDSLSDPNSPSFTFFSVLPAITEKNIIATSPEIFKIVSKFICSIFQFFTKQLEVHVIAANA
jgi:hypothetical protein